VRKDDELELRIDRLAYGGNGVARLNGFVVFVRRGLPGDLVRARVTKVKRSHAEATAFAVLEPGAARVVVVKPPERTAASFDSRVTARPSSKAPKTSAATASSIRRTSSVRLILRRGAPAAEVISSPGRRRQRVARRCPCRPASIQLWPAHRTQGRPGEAEHAETRTFVQARRI
jgi:predicted RNA-binding protein with TRAM domain